MFINSCNTFCCLPNMSNYSSTTLFYIDMYNKQICCCVDFVHLGWRLCIVFFAIQVVLVFKDFSTFPRCRLLQSIFVFIISMHLVNTSEHRRCQMGNCISCAFVRIIFIFVVAFSTMTLLFQHWKWYPSSKTATNSVEGLSAKIVIKTHL